MAIPYSTKRSKKYVSEISSLLRTYAESQNMSMPADQKYFEKMAWGGLQKTSLYKFAPEGTTYTISAERGNSPTLTQTLNCKGQ